MTPHYFPSPRTGTGTTWTTGAGSTGVQIRRARRAMMIAFRFDKVSSDARCGVESRMIHTRTGHRPVRHLDHLILHTGVSGPSHPPKRPAGHDPRGQGRASVGWPRKSEGGRTTLAPSLRRLRRSNDRSSDMCGQTGPQGPDSEWGSMHLRYVVSGPSPRRIPDGRKTGSPTGADQPDSGRLGQSSRTNTRLYRPHWEAGPGVPAP